MPLAVLVLHLKPLSLPYELGLKTLVNLSGALLQLPAVLIMHILAFLPLVLNVLQVFSWRFRYDG